MQYNVLNGKIAERGIKKKVIAETLGITPRAFSNKLAGRSKITWPEACIIQKKFFPDLDKDYLFADDPQKPDLKET